MMFLYSLKLFGSNWVKGLKLFLYYIVVWGVCLALLVPVFMAFEDLIFSVFHDAQTSDSFSGAMGSWSVGIYNFINSTFNAMFSAFENNGGLALYGLIVIFVFLPFFINVGKYTFCEMLYSYMTSKNKIGFFSAMMRGLKKALAFASLKTLFNLLFFVVAVGAVYGVGTITNETFVNYFVPIVLFLIFVLLFTFYEMFVLGWLPASIVFNCNIFSAYRKGVKAVKRHFWATFGTTMIYFFLFWLLIMIFGIYTMIVLVPLLSVLLRVYDMVMFFFSQGMRFYYNNDNILTPKKLEEVDNINKTVYIL